MREPRSRSSFQSRSSTSCRYGGSTRSGSPVAAACASTSATSCGSISTRCVGRDQLVPALDWPEIAAVAAARSSLSSRR